MTIVALLIAACTADPNAVDAETDDAVSEAAALEPPVEPTAREAEAHDRPAVSALAPEAPADAPEPAARDREPGYDERAQDAEDEHADESEDEYGDESEAQYDRPRVRDPFRFREREATPPADLEVDRGEFWEIARPARNERIWMRRNLDGHVWLELSLSGAPAGTQLFTFTDDSYGDSFRNLVAVRYPRAWVIDAAYDDGVDVYIRPIELEMAGPIGTRPRAALAASVELRRMQACPRSRRPCMLFGAPGHVTAANDPLYPPHGISVRVLALPAPLEQGLVTPTSAEPRLGTRPMPAIPEGNRPVTMVFHHPRGDRASFVLPMFHEYGFRYGVEEIGERTVVWVWGSNYLGFALHRRTTGERIGEPVVVRTGRYFPDSDAYPLPAPRPLPVLTADGARFAVFDRGRALPIYDLEGRYVRDVALAWEDVPPSGESASVPPFVELRDDGLLH